MKGFDTGYIDEHGNKILVDSEVRWKDSEGWYCRSEVIVKDGCMIGVETWEGDGFVLARDMLEKLEWLEVIE